MEEAAGVGLLFLGAFAFACIVLIIKGIMIVKQGQCVIVERFGKFHVIKDPGINFIIPIMDKPHRMEWRSSREWALPRCPAGCTGQQARSPGQK